MRLSAFDTQLTGSDDVTITVNSPAGVPAIFSVSPDSGRQGTGGTVSVVGQNTHFVQGTTQLDMGPGITVNSVTISCATCLSAQVTITDTASVGPHTVTLTTGSEIAASANGFTVQPGTPILTALSRAAGQPGQSFPVTITGRFTHFTSGVTQIHLGPGIVASAVTVANPTSLSAQVTIDATAALGPRTLTVSTGAEVVIATNAFTVAAAPSLTRIDLIPAGTVTLTKGQTFQFAAKGTFSDNTVQDPLAGITWSSDEPAVASVASSGLATGLAAGVAHIVATKGGIQSSPTSFVVKPLGIALVGPINGGVSVVDGAAAEPGASVRVSVNGLPRGPTVTASPTGAWVVTGLSPALIIGDSITARQTVNSVTSDDSLPIVVTPGTPRLLSISPATGAAGEQNLRIVIAGEFTHFSQGVSQVAFAGTAVTVSGLTVLSPTLLAANISIAANAQPIPCTVTVTTAGEVVTLPNAFTAQPGTNQSPTITIAPTWAVTLPNRVILTYTVTDDGLPFGGELTTSWDPVSGPGTVGFQNQTLTSISVGFDQPGLYTLRITATDTQFTVSQDVTVTVAPPIVTGPLVASISSPADGAEVTAPVSVVGTVSGPNLASWTLEIRGAVDTAFRPIAAGTTAVTEGTLGTLDPTLLMNGLTALQLRATDVGGQTVLYGPIDVVVSQNQKVGNFTVSFNDLSVPLAGLPIQVVRTYDSRNKATGEFGVGWRLDLNTVKVSTNGALGENWFGTRSGGLFPNYCIQPTKPHLVTITFGDGTVFQFQPTLSPACQQLVPITETAVSFTPMSTTPPNAALTVVGGNLAFIGDAYPGPITLLDLANATTFDPVHTTSPCRTGGYC